MSLKRIKVGDILNKDSYTINIHESIQKAALLVSSSQVSDLMVIDQDNKFIGVLSEGDLIRMVVPNFDELIYSGENTLAKACHVFLETAHNMANQPIDRLVIRNPITLRPEDEILKAAIVMVIKQIRRLPIVTSEKKFLGTICRGDICRAILTNTTT